MTFRPVALLALLLLTACAAPPGRAPTSFTGPNGRPAYSVRCGVAVERCFQQLAALCPNGYTMIDRATGVAAVPSGYGGILAAPQNSLAIECR